MLFMLVSFIGFAQEQTNVFVFTIDKEIDPRTNRLCELALEEAKTQEADLIILKLDTYGGAVVDADSIRKRLLDLPIPIYAFINKNAASAGALISIACDSIYMTSGSNIGAATVVFESGEAAPDKYQSYMRSMMRSTAEVNGRNPKIAEAMVDQSLIVDSISAEGRVITFTTSEAIKHGFCDAQVTSLEDILSKNNITNYQITHYSLPITENIIAFFLNPVLSGMLILIIIGGIYFEMQTPGVGFPIAASLTAAILYFIPYYLNGLAANWEIGLFGVGVILIGIELFAIPGFGVTGISGIILTFVSLMLVMINNDIFDFSFVLPETIGKSALALLVAGVGGIAFIIFGGLGLVQSTLFNRFAMQGTLESSDGFSVSVANNNVIGQEGQVYSDLRPSGKILIDGQLFSAESRGGYIEKDTKVVVLKEHGAILIVKKA